MADLKKRSGDKFIEEFDYTISFDYKLYWHDVLSSIAQVKMLAATHIIADADADRIYESLVAILADIEKGALEIENAEDVHSFIQGELIKRIGVVAKKLDIGVGVNDRLATDLRLYLKDSILGICGQIKTLIETLVKLSEDNIKSYMPAYNHSRISHPVSVGHYFNAYSEMFLRDAERFADSFKRTDVMPLGSGDVAGISYPIDRKMLAELLTFSEISNNSIDAVSDRDFVLEYLFCCSTVMQHLAKLADELIKYSQDEYGFIVIEDRFLKNMGRLSYKKYPAILEKIRGKSGTVFGNLSGMFAAMKGLPLSFSGDLQEDKETVFDTQDAVTGCLTIITQILSGLTFDAQAMKKASSVGYAPATYALNYLIDKGMPVADAAAIIDDMISYCEDNKTTLDKLDLFVFQNFTTLFGEDITELVKIKSVVENIKSDGGTQRASVKENIKSINKRLAKLFK